MSRNKREGNYIGNWGSEHYRQHDKANKRLLGWAFVHQGAADEFEETVKPFLTPEQLERIK